MTDEIGAKSEPPEDGDKVAKNEKTENDTKEPKRSVSFNRDVHVKRFGKPRESRGPSTEHQSPIRKEPFTHLSEEQLLEEANKVRAQAESVTCTADNPEKFFSLPHRKKVKEDRSDRRNSDEGTTESKTKSTLGRSASDVTNKKRKERTSLSTLFRRAQKNKSTDTLTVVAKKPVTPVKRSKSDISDLKSNTKLNTQPKPIRKRSGSETEEFLKSLRNKKTQLSPIIENSPKEDYFKKTSPLELYEKQKLNQKDLIGENKKVNPVEKPPRYKSPDKEPKPPLRTKRGKSSEKELSPSITDTPKRKTEPKKTLLVDEIDSVKVKEHNPVEIKERIKDSIRKIEENIYGDKEMIHSSQKPPDKPPLTRGNTVDHIVRILKEDQRSPPPASHLISPPNATNVNQPFSYLKPSISPDPNLFARNTSPERVPTPVNKMADKGVVYAHVVRDRGESNTKNIGKQTVHKTYSPSREKFGNHSDEDEGLGYEERYKFSPKRMYDYDQKLEDDNYNSIDGYKMIDSPIKPRYREFRLTNFQNSFEPTYANEYPLKNETQDPIDSFRGRADGMDTKRNVEESKNDLDFNELSYRRQLLESRLNARKYERERSHIPGEPISRYLAETDPIYEANKRMKATEKYVNETAKYYRQTLERDGFTESSVTEEFNKYDSENQKVKYNTTTRTFEKVPRGEQNRREFLDDLDTKPRYLKEGKDYPPEPEYEPPSLEINTGKPVLSPNEYKEKKYKVKKLFTSSQDALQSGQKYKNKEERNWFGKRKGHYASNPEIAKEREDDYANVRYGEAPESYHDSLRRMKNKDRFVKEDHGMKRHDSKDSRDYYRENRSPRRYEIDSRLVDSGIENDFRKDSSGEIVRSRYKRHESDEDIRNTSMFIDNERKHTEDYPSEQIYANGEYLATFKELKPDKRVDGKERTSEHRTFYDPKADSYERSPSRYDDKVSAKPLKASKKLSGLEKMKLLFSRDSSKKSKKEKEPVQLKTRTRVLKSPEHLAQDDCEYKRYTDPEPSDVEVKRKELPKEEERRMESSREDLNRYRSSERDSDQEKKYRTEYNERYERKSENRRFTERRDVRRQHSSERESDHRPSDAESDRRTRSRTAGPLDSPALAERYRGRRRLATPSPTPSPPRRQLAPPQNTASNWFKSLDRLTSRKKKDSSKGEKDSILTTEDESPKKSWAKTSKPSNSPAKNLRFFGDTDQDSDSNVKHSVVTKSRSHPQTNSHSVLRKTTSNSSTGMDEVDHSELNSKSYSLTNLKEDKDRSKYYKRNLHNISEIQSNSETESNIGRKYELKPPISPYERRSRSHSSSKTLKGSRGDLRNERGADRGRGTSSDIRRSGRREDSSSSELRSSRQELRGSRPELRSRQEQGRESKARERSRGMHSGGSSTEDSSPSQRSVVFLHATTVGDIPDPGRLLRNRSRDDVSSVNSSNIQVRNTTKSFSMFAPWSPRHTTPRRDLHYSQKPREDQEKNNGTLQKKKSYSQTTLNRRPQNSRLTSSSTTLYRKPEKRDATLTRKNARENRSQSNEVLNDDRERISRSISMKDNNKKAGWFKLNNKNKKEINTRVR